MEIVRGALGGLATALVIDLRSGDVAMAEQFLRLADVHAGFEQSCRGRHPERVGRAGAVPSHSSVRQSFLQHGSRLAA